MKEESERLLERNQVVRRLDLELCQSRADSAQNTQGSALPALRREHRTKAGVWGVIRVIEGRLKLTYLEPRSETVVTIDHPGLVLPEQPHLVEPLGPVRMQVDFYDRSPDG